MARVTVLVDEARWAWRGLRWAHLVSDDSYDELHEFARQLGKRRLGFQGDHYDVDAQDRSRALARGATPVDSRQLVRRLRAAGLRDRSAKPTWERIATWPSGVEIPAVDRRFAEALDPLGIDTVAADVGLFGDPRFLVLLLDLAPERARPGPSPHAWIGEPRADGWRSVEIFLSR